MKKQHYHEDQGDKNTEWVGVKFNGNNQGQLQNQEKSIMRKILIVLLSMTLAVLFSIPTISPAENGGKRVLVVMSYEKPSANPWSKEIKEGIIQCWQRLMS